MEKRSLLSRIGLDKAISTTVILVMVVTLVTFARYDLLPQGLKSKAALKDAGTTPAYDVIIVGAGSGGLSAAIQASRMGSKVLLLEETDQLGGQLLSVPNMDEGSTLIRESGIYKEFIEKIRAYYQVQVPPKSVGTCYWGPETICYEPAAARAVIAQMLQEVRSAGKILDVKSQLWVSAVLKDPQNQNKIVGVVDQKGATYPAKIVIDATEYGDVVRMTGGAYRIGNGLNTESGCTQDITYTVPIKKYAPGTMPAGFLLTTPPPGYEQARIGFARIIAQNGNPWFGPTAPYTFMAHNAYRGTPNSEGGRSYVATLEDAANITKTFINWTNDYPGSSYQTGINQPPLSSTYLSNWSKRLQTNYEARLKTMQFVYYIQTELGASDWAVDNTTGFDTAYNIARTDRTPLPGALSKFDRFFPPHPYVRESVRIVGMQTLTGRQIYREDGTYVSRTSFPSSIAVGYYPVDLHHCDTQETLESDLESVADVPPGFRAGPFQVPIEVLIPERIDGFLAAEKNISQSRLANGATRLQPITMLTGQAAGALASLSVQNNVQPRFVKPIQVQRALLTSGSSLQMVPYGDVPRSDLFWQDIQLASVYGIMKGYGSGLFGPTDSMTRRTGAIVIARSFKLPLDPASQTPTFTDVPTTDPDYKYIEAIYKAGITVGCSATPRKYCPDDTVTRTQLAVMIGRAMKLDINTAPSTPYFTDVPPTHAAFGYIQLLRQRGITSGCSATTFCPDAIITRSQAASFLIRELEKRN